MLLSVLGKVTCLGSMELQVCDQWLFSYFKCVGFISALCAEGRR